MLLMSLFQSFLQFLFHFGGFQVAGDDASALVGHEESL